MQDKNLILSKFGRLQGHCSPKGYRTNKSFESVTIISTDLRYNVTNNLVYNQKEQEKLLSEGKPCIFTDVKFPNEHNYNLYNELRLRWRPIEKDITLKSAIRVINKIKGIPKGTVIEFDTGMYIKNKKFSLSYLYKTKKNTSSDVTFEVTKPKYTKQFDTCKYSQELTNLLRENGFLVAVYENNEDGQIATAHGKGLVVGISSERNTFNDYTNAVDNILFDLDVNFNKWSQCQEISKDLLPKEVVELLINYK